MPAIAGPLLPHCLHACFFVLKVVRVVKYCGTVLRANVAALAIDGRGICRACRTRARSQERLTPAQQLVCHSSETFTVRVEENVQQHFQRDVPRVVSNTNGKGVA